MNNNIAINITRKCNMACSFCYYKTLIYKEETDVNDLNCYDISTELLESKLSQIDSIDKVYLSGGEPLLHPDLRSVISTVKKKANKIYVCTNGLLIDEIWSEYFIQQRITLIISLKDNSVATYRKLESLHEKGVDIELYHVLTKKSIDLLKNFTQRYWWISKLRLLFETSSNVNFQSISYKEWFTLLKISSHYLQPIIDRVEVEIGYLPKNHLLALSEDRGAVNNRIILDYDGKAYSCPLLVEDGDGSTNINNIDKCNIDKCPALKIDSEENKYKQVCPFVLTKLKYVF
jgi:sulfatase maturation enzyme AslB (radical SAM superfamily)